MRSDDVVWSGAAEVQLFGDRDEVAHLARVKIHMLRTGGTGVGRYRSRCGAMFRLSYG
jgi:hypothetical protein